MPLPHATEYEMGDVRAVWSDDNSRGLAHGAAGDWSLAADAFAAAADAIAGAPALGNGAGSHDALALVLGNLAGACFRAGRPDDAIRHAQRACALRVALVGEDAVAVARARSDLAVMLCAAGRPEEAYDLLARAIVGIEQHAGDDDARLAPVLENAARVAMAMARPANAEPHLLRLHALLGAHDLPTDRADALLAMVAASRQPQTPAFDVAVPAVQRHVDATPHAPDADTDVATGAVAAADDEFTLVEADDQPLRDAVVLTDLLLRTTPRGVLAIVDETSRASHEERAPIEMADAERRDEAMTANGNATREALAGMRARTDSVMSEPVVEDPEVAATFARELERDLHATLPASPLGFAVEYGFDGYEDERRASEQMAIAAETPVREAEVLVLADHAATSDDAPSVAPVVTEHPVHTEAERSAEVVELETARRRPFGTALRAGRATAPKSSHGVLIAAAITVAAGATAAWAWLRAAG